VFSFLSAFSIFFVFFLRFSTIIGLERGLSLLVFDMKKFVSRKRKIFSESRWCERPRREERRENFFFQKKETKKERERDEVVLKKVIFFSSLKTLSSFEKGTMIRFNNLSRERQSRYNSKRGF